MSIAQEKKPNPFALTFFCAGLKWIILYTSSIIFILLSPQFSNQVFLCVWVLTTRPKFVLFVVLGALQNDSWCSLLRTLHPFEGIAETARLKRSFGCFDVVATNVCTGKATILSSSYSNGSNTSVRSQHIEFYQQLGRVHHHGSFPSRSWYHFLVLCILTLNQIV